MLVYLWPRLLVDCVDMLQVGRGFHRLVGWLKTLLILSFPKVVQDMGLSGTVAEDILSVQPSLKQYIWNHTRILLIVLNNHFVFLICFFYTRHSIGHCSDVDIDKYLVTYQRSHFHCLLLSTQ